MQPIPILMAAPTVLILLLSWTLQQAGAGVLDRIAEEGVMRAGTRASAAPFAYGIPHQRGPGAHRGLGGPRRSWWQRVFGGGKAK